MERFSNPYRGNQRSKHWLKEPIILGSRKRILAEFLADRINAKLHAVSMSQRIVATDRRTCMLNASVQEARYRDSKFFSPPSLLPLKFFFSSRIDNESFTSAITAEKCNIRNELVFRVSSEFYFGPLISQHVLPARYPIGFVWINTRFLQM